jgi:RES domain-containing protein
MGTPIVYCADHPASALLEIIVHVDPEDLPVTYQLLRIEIPDALPHFSPDLPDDWRQRLDLTRGLGSAFVRERRFAVMIVPSAIVPFANNYLLSPAMLADAGIGVAGVTSHPIDQRLAQRS